MIVFISPHTEADLNNRFNWLLEKILTSKNDKELNKKLA